MNTQDFKSFIKSWEEIYALQGELQLMYRPYFKERIANFDINTLEDQELFKKLCWQIVEELTEAMEANDKNEEDHVLEELIDAFNFMLELYQLYGMAPDFAWRQTNGFRKNTADENFKENTLELIKTIGLAANCLKNRELETVSVTWLTWWSSRRDFGTYGQCSLCFLGAWVSRKTKPGGSGR